MAATAIPCRVIGPWEKRMKKGVGAEEGGLDIRVKREKERTRENERESERKENLQSVHCRVIGPY